MPGNLMLDLAFGSVGPVARKRRYQFTVDRRWPIDTFPGRSLRICNDRFLAFLQTGEERPPIGRHGTRILLEAGIEVLDIGGIGAMEKRGLLEKFVLGLLAHSGHAAA